MIVALQLFMFVRAILSWIMPEEENMLVRFVNSVTEPVIYPVRVLIDRIEALRNMPFDISFLVTFILLVILQYILPTNF
jgi:YggT family protein